MSTGVTEQLVRWEADGQGFRIDYSIRLLDKIRGETVDGLHRLPHGGIEVGGVLFGSRTEGGVRILAHRPLEIEYAVGPGFLLSENDEAALKRLIDETA